MPYCVLAAENHVNRWQEERMCWDRHGWGHDNESDMLLYITGCNGAEHLLSLNEHVDIKRRYIIGSHSKGGKNAAYPHNMLLVEAVRCKQLDKMCFLCIFLFH